MSYGTNILRFLGLLICILTISCSKDNTLLISVNTDEGIWLQELTSPKYNGRKTGTIECTMAKDYIVEELYKLGYTPKVQSFNFKDSITMNNIIVDIPGEIDSLVIIGAHYDGAVASKYYQAATDNASGVVALLSIAKLIGHSKFQTKLCFWDGEESTSNLVFNGSKYFVNSEVDKHRIRWYCNLDCCGRLNDDIYLYYSQSIQDLCSNAYELVSTYDNPNFNILKKIQNNRGSDYVPFMNAGIPIWGWNDCSTLKFNHTIDDRQDKVSISKIQYISTITLKMLQFL